MIGSSQLTNGPYPRSYPGPELDGIGSVTPVDEGAGGTLQVRADHRIVIIDAVVVHQHGELVAGAVVDGPQGRLHHVADPAVGPAGGDDDQLSGGLEPGEPAAQTVESLRGVALGVDPHAAPQAAALHRGQEMILQVGQEARERLFPSPAADHDGDVGLDCTHALPPVWSG
jgi:hypothetical protein